MPRTIIIAISAALLFAAAASAASATAREATNGDAVASLCTELPPFPQAGRYCLGPHCVSFNLSDRTVGPTFPTACRQST